MKSFRRSSMGRQHGLSFQISMLILSVMFTTSFHQAAAMRNTNLTWFEGSPRPWNETLYKTERKCIDFHPSIRPSYFYYWPEDHPEFHHCCGQRLLDSFSEHPEYLAADNFTHGDHGPKLMYKRYDDLGLIDDLCRPYWRCRNLYGRFMHTFTYSTNCEYTDLLRLYRRRFWHGCVLKYGILMSALPAIVSLEVLVLLAALFRVWQQDVTGSKKKFMVDGGRMWVKAVHKAVLIVWIHLVLLAVIGNGLIEAIGRQDAYLSQSKSYHNYARLYIGLSVLVWVSSLFQQVSYWIAVVEDSEVQPSQSDDQEPDRMLWRHTPVMTALEEKIGLNADWKWQPIAAQAGILFCMGGFLTYIDDSNSVASGLFGVVVQAAAPWSGLYAAKIIFKTLPFLLERMYNGVRSCWWPRPHSDGLGGPNELSAGTGFERLV